VTLQPLGFTRVVLGLLPGAPISATALAVEFASLLDVELLGLFIDDLGLRHLAAMPTARAISASGAGWSRLEPSHAPGAANFAVEGDARHFAEASRRLQRRRFEVVRGGVAQAIATISRSDDIVVIVPPSTAADRAAEPFASLLAAAFDFAAEIDEGSPFIVGDRARNAGDFYRHITGVLRRWRG
jgi:hypothetical protein